MSYHIQPFDSLPIKHYFMFGQVMQKPEICQLFLQELFVDWEIEKIEYVDREKDATNCYFSRGIRVMVPTKDSLQDYVAEILLERKEKIESRIRYCQYDMDWTATMQGVASRNLPQSYIIFVCDFDFLDLGHAMYERQVYWKNAHRPCIDGTHAILLNSHYKTGNVSPAMLEFLDYVRTNNDEKDYSTALVNQAREQVKRVRLDKEVGEKYMLHELKIQDALNKGEKIGTEKGIAIGTEKGELLHLIKVISKKIAKGKSLEVIADELEENISKIEPIYELLITLSPDCDPNHVYEALISKK